MDLIRPDTPYLDSYVHALEQGWSPDNMRPEVAREELERIALDPHSFLSELDDLEAKAPPIRLPDGTVVPRLPGFRRWMWDGAFCGSIGFRYQRGTETLPPYCLGHIGYAVVPWKRKRGYATRALGLLLAELAPFELRYVELTSDATNIASTRVIEANGGVLVESFTKPVGYGGGETLRFRIQLQRGST
jgi:predicted acetyltransferase